ncbi:MAG TPA: PDZ domain-containing protein [Gemmatimonadaceae bacterium]|nr:PDZ domain-containing protein [Gemmatimonadaceae bacterium]
MRGYKTLFAAAVLGLSTAPCTLHAQLRRFPAPDQGTRRSSSNVSNDADGPDVRALLGIAIGASGTDRDTLGLLVTQVMRDGPADRAGIDEGNRLAEIDGVSLRLDPNDIGRSGASDAAMKRMTRTLRGLRDGEQASIKVFSGGRFRSVTVQVGGTNAPNGLTAGSITVSPPTTPPAAIAVGSDQPSRPSTVAGALQSLTDLQTQLRRLSDDEGMTPLGDSLAQSARDIAAIQRRIRSAQEIRRRNDDPSDRSTSKRGSNDVPGLTLSQVSDDLADYFGDGSDRGLLVLQADPSWSPIRNGDVLLTIDGAPVTPDRLRAALDSRQSVRIDLLRRRRQMTVSVGSGRQ